MEQKQAEIDKLYKDLKKHQDFVNQSLERSRGQIIQNEKNHSTSQVKVIRVNNFIGGNNMRGKVASSHSPVLAAGSSKDSAGSQTRPSKLKKNFKVVQNPGKSPYLNNHFNKIGSVIQSSS